ncbi:hypothetical protein Asphe3_29870 [Pseudarthrobacter phenanthrenivorans Sphe3]|uniref:Alpha/beta hydrolase n=1 Tax=Pseudarthrobacter phenanthrenivorans (strain DSM 18606 / JCM 16027 / LMG 23796 / Sphe3) TaxID=930171 RepID=F0MBV7_PSEPM|nr:hypothetical protein [Pseudarthrobacter phenanthrenivorans]ADX74098.1 hypothetical protein Asphe3_29870 [Pseudarthrobacter phenanthrenivorans Sphe3]
MGKRAGCSPGDADDARDPDHPDLDQPELDHPDHVVVFVHGMGRALKGGTLQEWAQPLMLSLHDLSLDMVPHTSHPHLVITKANAVGDAPEVLVKVLRSVAGRQPDYLTVLMTEASWGRDFEPASAASTYSWALRTALRVYLRSVQLIKWNLYPGRRRASPAWLGAWLRQLVLASLAAFAGFFILLAVLVVLLLIIVLAWIPGPGRWVGKLVSLFADFLGDPQVWKRRPLQAAAMRQRVVDTLQRWDHGAGTEVTVVAHSQGAAITGQVLFQNQARATNFVSVGSGLDLLGYAQWGGGTGEDPVTDWLANPRRPRWINVWGKFDFVPAGPISTHANGPLPVFGKLYERDSAGDGGPGPEEHPVYNRSALIYDHIVYSKNRVEVLDPLARLILDPPPASSALAFRVLDGDRRLRPHRVMVKSLGVTRLLAVLTSGLSAPAALAWLGSQGWARDLVQCGPAGAGQDPWWSSWLCSGPTYHWAHVEDWGVLAITAAVFAGVLVGILNGPVWGVLHNRLQRIRKPSFRQSSDPTRNPPANPWWSVAGYLLIVTAVAVVLPFLLAWPEMPWVAVVVLVVALWSLCFTRTSITGLPARTGGLGAQPTASGSLPVNTVTGAEDQRSRSGS